MHHAIILFLIAATVLSCKGQGNSSINKDTLSTQTSNPAVSYDLQNDAGDADSSIQVSQYIRPMLQDTRTGGVSRYDGKAFTNFSTKGS